MSEPANCILVVDDSNQYTDTITSIISKTFPQFQPHFIGTIRDAYWKYVEQPELYKLVLLDFNLEGNRSRSNFNGIDLALMIDTFAKRRKRDIPSLETPWLVAFTGAAEELLECFFNILKSTPLMGVIQKQEGPTHVRNELHALFSVLADNDAKQFRKRFLAPYKKFTGRFEPQIEYDEEALNQLCPTYRNRGKGEFEAVANNITKSLLSSYRFVNFSALAPGYSGSEILSVVARRSKDLADYRTFVVKLTEIKKDKKGSPDPSLKLEDEAENYYRHAGYIREHVPLLIGPFTIKDWRFIAYEFVSVQGYGVCTFADHLRSAIRTREQDTTSERFGMGYSGPHSRFIFGKILKNWHDSRELSDVPQDTHLIYDQDWFRPHLTEVEQRIADSYDNLRPALKRRDHFLNFDIFAPEKLTLVNPLFVAYNLLSKSGPSYREHFLSSGLVHGDLHSGNILRSLTGNTGDPGEWVLIDFANIVATHLSQDAARLECDIKIQQLDVTLRPRFALEVELAAWLDLFLEGHLKDILDIPRWSEEWAKLPINLKLIERQIKDIREITIIRLEENQPGKPYSPFLDYTVALLMQSLMFVRYIRHPVKTQHAWLAACLAATLIYQHFSALREQDRKKDVGGSSPWTAS